MQVSETSYQAFTTLQEEGVLDDSPMFALDDKDQTQIDIQEQPTKTDKIQQESLLETKGGLEQLQF